MKRSPDCPAGAAAPVPEQHPRRTWRPQRRIAPASAYCAVRGPRRAGVREARGSGHPRGCSADRCQPIRPVSCPSGESTRGRPRKHEPGADPTKNIFWRAPPEQQDAAARMPAISGSARLRQKRRARRHPLRRSRSPTRDAGSISIAATTAAMAATSRAIASVSMRPLVAIVPLRASTSPAHRQARSTGRQARPIAQATRSLRRAGRRRIRTPA